MTRGNPRGDIGNDDRKEMDTNPTARNINATDHNMEAYKVKDVKEAGIFPATRIQSKLGGGNTYGKDVTSTTVGCT